MRYARFYEYQGFRALIYTSRNLRTAIIPGFPLPLRSPDVEPIVDLQGLLNTVYDRAAYDITLDYTADLVPVLSEADAAWADALLEERGFKGRSQITTDS